VEVVAEDVGFLPSAVLSFEDPRILKEGSCWLEAIMFGVKGVTNIGICRNLSFDSRCCGIFGWADDAFSILLKYESSLTCDDRVVTSMGVFENQVKVLQISAPRTPR
jgi:hypothetical protein